MSLPGQLNPSPRLLLGPGPSDVHPRVLSVMTTPLMGHLDPQFLILMNETQEMLRQALLTKNHLTLPISATGMAGMETCMVNLLEPGDKIVVELIGRGRMEVRPAEPSAKLEDFVGCLKRSKGRSLSNDEIKKITRKGWAGER